MNANLKYLGFLAILPLLTVALTTDYIGEADAITKGAGVGTKQFGAATKSIVCGDRLCSETGGKTVMPSTSTEEPAPTEEPVEESTIEEVAPGSVLRLSRASVPATIPMHQGYYNGEAVYYIITDSSDPTHVDIITKNQGWKVNLAPLLANATKNALSTTYMFTNGLPGDGVHGFQGEVFTSTPAQADAYSALTSQVRVTWDDEVIPRILVSETEILSSVQQRLVVLTELNVVLNMPQIVWTEGQMPVKANKTLTNETPFVGGQILDIDLKNMTTTFIARQGWDYEGKTIYFIVTDATPVGPAISLEVTNVPKNAALISNPAAVDVFHFMNGIKGSGPFGFQAGIASGSTGDPNYSPMSRIYFIAWNDPDSAVLLETRSDIDEFEKEDLITINLARPMGADHIVNSPIIDLFPLKLID